MMNNIKAEVSLYLGQLKCDFPASIVVFLMSLPLCLGIALASGAPLISGIVAGLVGGIVVSWASGSQLSISGPAAGISIIVFDAIGTLGSFDALLLSVILAGVLQIAFGYLKAGFISAFFPNSVINGMLSAIGYILIIKQIPHATGFDVSFDGDESYMQETAGSSFFELFEAIEGVTPGITLVTGVSLLILMLWERPCIKKFNWFRFIPAQLWVVIWGVSYNPIVANLKPEWLIAEQHFVALPSLGNAQAFIQLLHWPDLSYINDPDIYTIAATIAILASLQSLLSIEAIDKLDPFKRISPSNRELKAQGLGNILSGLMGGLPIATVIVRSSANINAGGRTRMACFLHGVLLLLSVMFFTEFLTKIPLACLAAILLQTGYKLAKPQKFFQFYRKGWHQFLPFTITVLAILLTDLLQGIAIGCIFGFYFVLKANYHQAISLVAHGSHYLLRLQKDVSFLNKAVLRQSLNSIPSHSELIIDGVKAQFIDDDIMEMIADFMQTALDKHIVVELVGIECDMHSKSKV